MSHQSPPAASHPADRTDEAPSALRAVQEALDRRDNGGTAGSPPAAAGGEPATRAARMS